MMGSGGWMVAQLVGLSLLASALLVVWGDLGSFPVVRRLSGGVKFLAGLLLIAGMIGVVVYPTRGPQGGGGSRRGALVALDWQLISAKDGRELNLASLKGKVLFINVWATWCGPCVQELPSIERLYRKFAGRDDVAFLLITGDDAPEDAAAFAAARGMTAPVYVSKGPTPLPFRTSGIPATFIVRKDATVHFADVGYKEWDTPSWAGDLKDLARERGPQEPTP